MAWAKILKMGGVALGLSMATPSVAAQRGRGPSMSGCSPISRPGLLAESAPGRITFDGGVARVALIPTCGAALTDRVQRSDGRRVILLVDDLRAGHASGDLFAVYFADRSGNPLPGPDASIGTLNFFGARPLGASGGMRSVSFDVSAMIRLIARMDRLDGVSVVVNAEGSRFQPAELSVARLQLVVQ